MSRLSLTIFLSLITLSTSLNHQISEKELIAFRASIFTRLDQCTQWKSTLAPEVFSTLDHFLVNSKFAEFRDAAIPLASEHNPESIDCIDGITNDIDKYEEYVKGGIRGEVRLMDLLGEDRILELHMLMAKTKRPDLIEKGLHQHFHGLSEKRRQQLLEEFYALKPSRVRRSTINRPIAREPAPLSKDMLTWQGPRHKNLVAKARTSNGSRWDVMNVIGNQFYHLRKSVRLKYDTKFMKYCNESIKEIIGNHSFKVLEDMYQDSEQIEHISNRYNQIIGYLGNEEDQLTAEHYGQFCRKIYRLVPIEQADLMSWLSASQKVEIAALIQDEKVNDSEVYEKIYEFFKEARGDARDEAEEVITLGCRKFIAHHLGDQLAEDIEDLRVAGAPGSGHYTAALLAVKHYELERRGELAHQRRIEDSLSICKRIYLDFDGSDCFCNSRSTICDKTTHVCQNCSFGTIGFQCEKCPVDMRLDKSGKCVDGIEECFCNNHSLECIDGVCQNCDNNTVGENCELCDVGYYGDPAKGNGCVKCPCPKNGECSYNTTTNRIECNDCPRGHIGERCEDNESSYQPFTTESSTVTIVDDNQL